MVALRVIFGKFLILFYFSFIYFEDVLNKAFILLSLIGYEMIIISSSRAREIFVN